MILILMPKMTIQLALHIIQTASKERTKSGKRTFTPKQVGDAKAVIAQFEKTKIEKRKRTQKRRKQGPRRL
jgi:hypothetical protein